MVEFPEPYCEQGPNRAHHFVQIVGNIWRCKYCWAVKWLPSSISDAVNFSNEIKRFGLEAAYQRLLKHRPRVVEILERMEDFRLLRKAFPEDERNLMIAIAAVITEKEGSNAY